MLEGMIDGKLRETKEDLGNDIKKWANCNDIGKAKRRSENQNVWRKMVHNL